MKRSWWSDSALALLAMGVSIGAIVLVSPDTGTPMTTASALEISRPEFDAKALPSILFIGDSYTAGESTSELSYGCAAAVQMEWKCDLAAVPGTGYISGGPANRFVADYIGESTSFSERIPRLAARFQPSVVVLDGGRNDLFPPAEDVFAEMTHTIAEVRRAWPDATVVFLRPRYLSTPLDDLGFDDEFIAALQATPVARGVYFLDPIRDVSSTTQGTSDLLAPDGLHPNEFGYEKIGEALTKALIEHNIGDKS